MTYLHSNPFERLVTAACQPFWAGHSVGNHEFIHGLQLISIGKLPTDTVTIDEVSKIAFELGLSWSYRIETDRDIKLSRDIIRADLRKFSVLQSPYWFGCLELVFQYFTNRWNSSALEDNSSHKIEKRKICWLMISSAWAEQFLEILRCDMGAILYEQLEACKEGTRPLGENDLEQTRGLFAGQIDWAWNTLERQGKLSEIRI